LYIFIICISYNSLHPISQPGFPPGDVVFVLKQTHHETFERAGNDLLTKVRITLAEALLGFSRVLVTHLDARGIQVTSPPGKIVKPGEAIVVRGEGMPIYKDPGQKRGDLYVVLDVEMPSEEWLASVDRQVSRLFSSCLSIE
jgi:DnaJ homolog subfamily A member 2